jgi:hypothetical protein
MMQEGLSILAGIVLFGLLDAVIVGFGMHGAHDLGKLFGRRKG